ncbi:transmembrane protein 266-like [Micropterus salmoides]|uniref:transmembrane protein 266-like n=1 Tax=Micropterus salmoides TaxID=27706 RepID=UPI0018EB6D79|nr:transmembrane protein 266-like [Micropterus salmoides]
MSKPHAPPQTGASELEVISQQVEEDNQCVAPVQLVSFAYRDLPLAALDISLAGSQLISNPDEEDNREGYVPRIHSETIHQFLWLLDNLTTISKTISRDYSVIIKNS